MSIHILLIDSDAPVYLMTLIAIEFTHGTLTLLQLVERFTVEIASTVYRGLNCSCGKTYFKSLRYNRKVYQQLEMLFIHHYTSSGKINQTKYCKR